MSGDYIEKTVKGKASRVPLFISMTLLLVLIGSYFIFPGVRNAINEAFKVLTSEDEERIQAWVSQFGILGPIALIVGMVVQMFMFVIPNVLLMMIAILSYGPVWGGVISFVGVFASSSLGYVIGRYIGPVTVNKLINIKNQQKISQFIEDYGIGAILITRLASISNDSLSFVAGILKMSYQKYISATLAGITPLIVLLAIYGKNGKIEKALIVIGGLSLILLVLYIIIDKRRKKRRNRTAITDA
jgi:uncharacterized membrane protein YdjX (TVP38/TMEM64 family)